MRNKKMRIVGKTNFKEEYGAKREKMSHSFVVAAFPL